jgi:hypothetical protein
LIYRLFHFGILFALRIVRTYDASFPVTRTRVVIGDSRGAKPEQNRGLYGASAPGGRGTS